MSISTIAARFGGVSLAAALLLGPGAAWAQNAHFVKGPTGSIDPATGDYTVSFKEAGLGSTPITYELTATTADFTFRCFTKSNNTPQGSPNSISISNESTFVTLTPHNGQITGSISLMPEKDGASCQGGGLKLCLVAASYSGVAGGDTTTPLSFGPLPDLAVGSDTSTTQLECFSSK
jgi:hypothetical protein